jgi:hypothetical protein
MRRIDHVLSAFAPGPVAALPLMVDAVPRIGNLVRIHALKRLLTR